MSDLHPVAQLALAFGAVIGVGGLMCAFNDGIGWLMDRIGGRK